MAAGKLYEIAVSTAPKNELKTPSQIFKICEYGIL